MERCTSRLKYLRRGGGVGAGAKGEDEYEEQKRSWSRNRGAA